MTLSLPARHIVRGRLLELVEGRATRRKVSDWADTWVMSPEEHSFDPVVWEALVSLSGADTPASDTAYLYSELDFQLWLDDLDSEKYAE